MSTVPSTVDEAPPNNWPWKSAMWLLGRHPRLVDLADRIPRVMVDNSIDHDHLADVVAAVPRYVEAWDAYTDAHRAPRDEDAWEAWRKAGPQTASFAYGLSELLVMSSGETAMLLLLATFGHTRVPFRINDLSSLDEQGHRLLADWCEAVKAS